LLLELSPIEDRATRAFIDAVEAGARIVRAQPDAAAGHAAEGERCPCGVEARTAPRRGDRAWVTAKGVASLVTCAERDAEGTCRSARNAGRESEGVVRKEARFRRGLEPVLTLVGDDVDDA